MNSHNDSDFDRTEQFLADVRAKADRMKAAGQSIITGGADGETPLKEWEQFGVTCRQLPDDEHGILRISIGGGPDIPVPINYCVFRGDRKACADLLRKALAALTMPPKLGGRTRKEP